MITVKQTLCEHSGRALEAEAKCLCGNMLDMLWERDAYNTIECEKCGRLWNSSGQALKPRNQWEEPLEPEE
jgi:hypothetical protein